MHSATDRQLPMAQKSTPIHPTDSADEPFFSPRRRDRPWRDISSPHPLRGDPWLLSKAKEAGRVCESPRGFRERDRDLAWPGARNFSPGRCLPRGRFWR